MSLQLTIDDLTVSRGGRPIISGLSAVVDAGSALLLLGANGSGKTTALRAIAGALPVTAGAVDLIGGDEGSIAEQAHAIGHGNAVKAGLTVLENARFWAAYLGGTQARVLSALDRFQLETLSGVPARYLSAGQQRRLGLARLLVAERPLWLLDEPTSSLDSSGQGIVVEVINEHLEKGGLAVVATHMPLLLHRSRELRMDRQMQPA